MFIKKSLNIRDNKKILIFILFISAILINQYYGYRGVFPIDTFLIFDAGYNIISGNHPFKDYWSITGPFLDYIQSFFFLIFGVNWASYVLHASILNMLLALYSFYFFSKIGLKNIYCFFYSLGVSIIAYPGAGTPFIDHHAVIFSVFALYSIILGILLRNNFFWFLIPVFITFSFFSKQIPSSYITILFIFFIIFYFFYIKNNKFFLIYLLCGLLFSLLLISSIFFINNIPIKNFLIQYIFYPLSLGEDRILKLNIDFKNLVSQFKFIYLALFPLLLSLLSLISIKKKTTIQKDELIISIVFILSIAVFIYCQLLTKNQIFIFFLIPICGAFSHAYVIKFFNKKYLIYFILLIFVFSTIKYHIRFNHNKKFMELVNANFNMAIDAEKLDSKFKGLKWISPYYIDNPSKEINLLIDAKKILATSKEKRFIITDYLFFSSLLETNFASPNKWYDNLSVPESNNRFYNEYKSFFLSKIKTNNIDYVYLLRKNEDTFLKQFIDDKNCITSINLNEMLVKFDLSKCIF